MERQPCPVCARPGDPTGRDPRGRPVYGCLAIGCDVVEYDREIIRKRQGAVVPWRLSRKRRPRVARSGTSDTSGLERGAARKARPVSSVPT